VASARRLDASEDNTSTQSSDAIKKETRKCQRKTHIS